MLDLRSYTAGVVLALAAPLAAQAALLDVPTRSAPMITDQGFVGYDVGLNEFTVVGSLAGVSSDPAASDVEFVLTGNIEDGGAVGGFGGSFAADSFSAGFILTSGSLADFGFDVGDGADDVLQFLFDDVSGPAGYGGRVLVTLLGQFGTSASFLQDDIEADADVTVEGVIPLPAAGLLLLTGLGALALRRRG